jgi:Family of unknown function (DUF6796)
MAACDMAYLGQPLSGSEAVAAGFKVMLGIPGWRLFLGGAVGLVFGALYLFGFWHVQQNLAPAGRWLSFAVFVLFSFTWFLGSAVHAGFPFVGLGVQAEQVAANPAERAALGQLSEQLASYLFLLMYLLYGPFIAGSLLFGFAVAFRRTHYPRWFAGCTPFILLAATLVVSWQLPAPVGGYVYPASYNLAMAGFFGLSLSLLSSADRENGRTTRFT